jgi:pimeloyl-ACP methyl ester carboxylesterase
MPTVDLAQGRIHYRVAGPADASAPPVVFVHGLLVNSELWSGVAWALAGQGVRSYAPDLPLGSHTIPLEETADLSPRGVARLILDFLDALDLRDVTLVGNDTGGALCQLVVASHPERITRLVLTNCDAFEAFPPPKIAPLVRGLASPGVVRALATVARLRAARQLALSAMPLTMEPVDDDLLREWVAPLSVPEVRRDLVKVARGISPEHTMAAAERFPDFTGPTTVAWGTADRLFAFSLAERLAAAFRHARLERIENAKTFVQLDAPERLGQLILEV